MSSIGLQNSSFHVFVLHRTAKKCSEPKNARTGRKEIIYSLNMSICGAGVEALITEALKKMNKAYEHPA